MEPKVKSLLKDCENKLGRIFGDKLEKIILFGSYVREDYDDESDIDLFVLVNDDHLDKYDDPILDMIVELTGVYGIFVSVVVKNIVEYDSKKDTIPLFVNVAKEGLEVYAA